MFRPISLYIGLRYTRAKRRNHYISFISLASVIGIALGVMVLITVLSVMNGFDTEIKDKIFGMAQQVTVQTLQGSVPNWVSLNDKLKSQPNVLAAAPYIQNQGMLNYGNQTSGVLVNGINPTLQKNISVLHEKVVEGSMKSLKPRSFGIVIGRKLADDLGVSVGDRVKLITPQATMTPVGIIPTYKLFKVVGVFEVGGGFGFDRSMVYINLSDAQALYRMGKSVTGLALKINDLYNAPTVAYNIAGTLSSDYVVGDWTRQYGAFFKAIRMEKTMMFVILMFIIAVAAFNLVSTLVMVVTDKQADIAILRTLGASPRAIMRIFIVQGSVIGIFGTLLGVIGGIILALNATEIVSAIERLFHVKFISSSIYFINYLPSRLEWSDVWHIGLAALAMALLATLYPAWRASRTQPAEALRYE